MDYEFRKLTCPQCGRKILVEVFLVGVSHNAGINAICAECLDFTTDEFKSFETERPLAAKQIQEWAKIK